MNYLLNKWILCLILVIIGFADSQAAVALTGVYLTPNDISLSSGCTVQLCAYSLDDSGQHVAVSDSINWSANSAAGTINTDGVFTATGLPGNYASAVSASFNDGSTATTAVEIINARGSGGYTFERSWSTSYGSDLDGYPRNGNFQIPCDVAVGSNGLVYVADTLNCRIQVFDTNGSFVDSWGEADNLYLAFPLSIAVDNFGDVFSGWNKFDSSGNVLFNYAITDRLALRPTVTVIAPDSGANTGSVNIKNLKGTGFVAGATVKLTKSGQSDITATSVVVASASKITCTFSLTGRATGLWNVVVTNPDTQFGTLVNGFTITDGVPPTVTIDQASSQADPTGVSPINFTVVFNESVTDFATGDVTLSGTAGATTATVTGSGTTYNVAVTGMTASGTVITSLASGVAHDAAGNASVASTSTDNTVAYDNIVPTITINQASSQADPTGASPINFTVIFSETVFDFATGDVTLSGTAGATTATVTGSGTTYNVAVAGMIKSGTVIASLAAGVAHDAAGNSNTVSTSTDKTVQYNKPDTTPPTVTINQASGQADPTGVSPINFTVVFSETVSDFANGDVALSGTAGATTGTVTGSGTTYNVAVSGMTASGTVIASLAAGVAHDAAGNANTASSSTDKTVQYNKPDTTPPTVTSITPASAPNTASVAITNLKGTGFVAGATVKLTKSGQSDITATSVVVASTSKITCTFGLTGKATGTWNVVVTNPDLLSGTLTNGFTVNSSGPSVTAITPNSGANTGSVNITNLKGTGFVAGATVKLTKSGQSDIAATSVVVASTSKITCTFGLTGKATGTWNVVVTNPDLLSGTLTNGFTVNASALAVTGLTPNSGADTGSVNITNLAGTGFVAGATVKLTKSGQSDIAATSVVVASASKITCTFGLAGKATGMWNVVVTNPSALSETLTNGFTVTDGVSPTVTINQAAGQADPTNASPVNFTVVFSENVTGFDTGDVTVGGTAGAVIAEVTGSGLTYNVAVSGMTRVGTVTVSVVAGVAQDAAGNANTVSTSTDNSVQYNNGVPEIAITAPVSEGVCVRTGISVRLVGVTSEGTSTVTGVAWRNETTGETGLCSGTAAWEASDVPLQVGENKVTVTATDNSGKEGMCSMTFRRLDVQGDISAFWRSDAMISLPIVPDCADPADVVDFELLKWWWFNVEKNAYDGYLGTDSRSLCWFNDFGKPVSATPGRGFWAKFPDVSISVPNGTVPAKVDHVDIHLDKGWNMIGNPFLEAVNWDIDSILVRSADGTAVESLGDSSLMTHTAYGWDVAEKRYYIVDDSNRLPGWPNDKLVPWQAYWVKALSDCVLVIPSPI